MKQKMSNPRHAALSQIIQNLMKVPLSHGEIGKPKSAAIELVVGKGHMPKSMTGEMNEVDAPELSDAEEGEGTDSDDMVSKLKGEMQHRFKKG